MKTHISNASKGRRINLTVPPKLYSDIHFISSRMGVSASSLIFNVCSEALTHMASVLRSIEPTETAEVVSKRLRGESIDYIKAQYDRYMSDCVVEADNERH